jgi:hypothetical protein
MKKELQMTIKRNGALNEFICNIIGVYNEGKEHYTLVEISAILKGKKINMPHTLENLNILHLGNEIIVSENGKDISVIIEEREMMVLNENVTDEI